MKEDEKAGKSRPKTKKTTSPGRQEGAMYGKEDVPGWNWLYVNSRLYTGLSPLSMYLSLTGKANEKELKRIGKGKLTKAENVVIKSSVVTDLLHLLYGLFQVSSYQHLLNEYDAGNVSPELKEILDYQPNFDVRAIEAETSVGSEFKTVVWAAAQEGKIDFSPYNRTGDPADDWFLKYEVRPNPIPGIFGSVASLRSAGPLNSPSLDMYHEGLKQEMKKTVIAALMEELQPEELQAEEPPSKRLQPEDLLTLAGEIKKSFDELEAGKEYPTTKAFLSYPYSVSPFPYNSEYSAGFAVDVSAGVIHDMRDHAEELWKLLKPDFNPLKEFYYALHRYVKDFKDGIAGVTEHKVLDDNFLGEDPFMMMKNSPESNAIASVSTGITAMVVQQELPGISDGEPKYNYVYSTPVKSGEVIVKVSETPKGQALSPGTEKLQILFDTLYTISGQMNFPVPIDGYMELCREDKTQPISPVSRRKFKRKMVANLKAMRRATFEAKIEGAPEPGEIGILRNWLPMPGNKVLIELEPRYCATLNSRRSGKMQIAKAVFRLPEKNPHLVTMLRKLSNNRTMYSNVNCNESRAYRISLKSLYEYDRSFPTIKFLMKKRNYRRDVIIPMFNAIKTLNDLGYIKSTYIDKDGIEHEPEELEAVNFFDFIDPQKWLLEYDLFDPETGEAFKDNAEQMQAAEQRKQERKEQASLAYAKKLVAEDRRRRKQTEDTNKN